MKKQIDEIMEEFDFKKVHSVMKYVDWRWVKDGDDDFEMEIPNIERMKETARRLLEESAEKDREEYASIATGGFKATRYPGDHLGLEFVLADWDTCE
jgi:hypothetical protein